jgi:hypothetical protein
MGTELDVGAQYRFAPHVVLDVGGGWLFSGPALATATATSVNGITRSNSRPHDVQTIVTRLRYFF